MSGSGDVEDEGGFDAVGDGVVAAGADVLGDLFDGFWAGGLPHAGDAGVELDGAEFVGELEAGSVFIAASEALAEGAVFVEVADGGLDEVAEVALALGAGPADESGAGPTDGSDAGGDLGALGEAVAFDAERAFYSRESSEPVICFFFGMAWLYLWHVGRGNQSSCACASTGGKGRVDG